MKLFKTQSLSLLFCVSLIVSMSVVTTSAQGGKKGGATLATHRLVVLDVGHGGATAMTQAVTVNNLTEVDIIGWVGDDAQFWRVLTSAASSETVESIRLSLPPDVDIEYPGASANAINASGMIVGGCRRIDAGPGQPLIWENELAEPTSLPLPAGFSGWAMPRAINNAGVIVGELSGDLVNGDTSSHVEGLIVWLATLDQDGNLIVDPPSWFSIDGMSHPGLNDAGWIALDCIDGDFRLRLAHQWVEDEELGRDVAQFYIDDVDGPLFGTNQVAFVGGINQAGDLAGIVRTVNQPGQDVFAKRLDGSLLNMPLFVNDRTYGTYVAGVAAINDATPQHAVQVLGQAGVYYKKSPTSIVPRGWAIWESAGSVRLLKDNTELPSDSTYDFLASGSSFNGLNDASWICGQIARGTARVGVPTVLIRKP